MRLIIEFLREEEAATAVEYGVVLALILMVVIGAVGSVGAESGGMWGGIESKLSALEFFGAPEAE